MNALSRFHSRIAEKTQDNNEPAVLIVALGDSVTAGVGATDEFLHDEVYHAQLKHLLEARYPGCIFSVLNAGQNGQNAEGAMTNLRRNVLHHQPDLLLIGFGLNDATRNESDALQIYAQALEALISTAREATSADIIVLTPNMMPRYESERIPDQWRHVTELFLSLQNDGVLASYAQCAREVAERNDVAVADVYVAWEELEKRGVDTTAILSNGLNHPDASGHRLAAEVIMNVITANEIKNGSRL